MAVDSSETEAERPEATAYTIRPRQGGDLDRFLPMAVTIKTTENYPEGLPSADSGDLRTFLEAAGNYGAWVAVARSAVSREKAGNEAHDVAPVAGHVVLVSPRPGPVTELLRQTTGREPPGLGMVARLVISQGWRGRGVARALLRTAAEEARQRGLLPVLDTLVSNLAARSLYESEGWRVVGPARTHLSWGHELDQLVYVAPLPGR